MTTTFRTPHIFSWISGALGLLALATGVTAGELTSRQPVPKAPVRAISLPADDTKLADERRHRLIVNFRDDVRARSDRGAVISDTGADLSEAYNAARGLGLSFSPLIQLPAESLTELENRTSARSLKAQPDLAGILVVDMVGAGPAELEAAGEALQRLPEVEFAYIQTLGAPPPADIAPKSSNHVDLQTYRGSDPGIDCDYAASLGFTGTGVRHSDCYADPGCFVGVEPGPFEARLIAL